MLNIAIVIKSLFLGLHLLLVPTETTKTYSYSYFYSYWAVGNKTSCAAAGFFVASESLVTSMYHTNIAFYFYCSIQPMRSKNDNYDQKTKKGDDDNRNTKTKTKTKMIKQGSEEASESSKFTLRVVQVPVCLVLFGHGFPCCYCSVVLFIFVNFKIGCFGKPFPFS